MKIDLDKIEDSLWSLYWRTACMPKQNSTDRIELMAHELHSIFYKEINSNNLFRSEDGKD